jgi:hypothetical protein
VLRGEFFQLGDRDSFAAACHIGTGSGENRVETLAKGMQTDGPLFQV